MIGINTLRHKRQNTKIFGNANRQKEQQIPNNMAKQDTVLTEKIWYFVIALTGVFLVLILLRFDKNALPDNKTVSLSKEKWFIINETGEPLPITLPYSVSANNNTCISLSTRLTHDYSGQILAIRAQNAFLKVSINNNVFFKNWANKEGYTRVPVPQYEIGSSLNFSLASNGSEKTILEDIRIETNDKALTEQTKAGLVGFVPCMFMAVFSSIVILIGAIRLVIKWKEERIGILMFFLSILCASCFASLRLFPSMFGNEEMFNVAHNLLLSITPVILCIYLNSDTRIELALLILSSLCPVWMVVFCTMIPSHVSIAETLAYLMLTIIAVCYVIKTIIQREYLWHVKACWLIGLIIPGVSKSMVINKSETPAIILPAISVSAMFAAIWQAALFIKDYRNVVEQSEQEALRANEFKSAFLANMSHEIRTPINAVLGMNEMILRESNEKNIKEYAKDIHLAGNNLLSIINDILDLSKIESGKMEIVPTEYNTGKLFHETVLLISPKAKDKNLEFIIQISPSVPTKLYGDDMRIRQILINLLSNSVKYTEKGKIGLCVKWEPDGDAGSGTMICEVRDTGIGIKEEDLPRLFEKFSRFDEALHKHTEGTGLGLSITTSLLSLMGSRLAVKSKYGKGSIFRFELKQKIIDPEPIGDFEKIITSELNIEEHKQVFTAPDARILIVDDNEMNRKVFCSLLKETEISITEASSGKECLEYISKEHFDIIFLDHLMPDMDGIETLKELRKINDETPVFILTANAIAGAKEEYLEKGFDGYLSKPIIPEDLEETVLATLPEGLVNAQNTTVKKEKHHVGEISIQNIDTDYASLHFPNNEGFLMACREFCKSARPLASKLDSLSKKLPLPDGVEEYRICVHGMKSTASTIGAMPVYGLAKALENLAKEKNTKAISTLHPIFIKEWALFTKELEKSLGIKPQQKKPVDKEGILKELRIIETALNDSDIDTADRAVAKLSAYKYNKQQSGIFKSLKEAVNDIDTDKASEAIKELEKII